MPSLSSADHRAVPPHVDVPRDYNAAHDLIERNLAAGRAGKAAFVDDRGTYTYGDLAQRVEPLRQCAAEPGCRARGARPALPSRHHRFSVGVPGRDQGRNRPGRREHAADHQGLRVHAARQPRRHAARLGGALSDVRAAHRQDARSAPRRRRRRDRRARRGGASLARPADGECGHDLRCGRDDLRRHVLLALFVGVDRRAQGHRAHPFEPRSRRRSSTRSRSSAFARTTSCFRRQSSSSPTASATASHFRWRSAPRRS